MCRDHAIQRSLSGKLIRSCDEGKGRQVRDLFRDLHAEVFGSIQSCANRGTTRSELVQARERGFHPLQRAANLHRIPGPLLAHG